MARNGRTGGSRKRPGGFTLTELLVVISIICLLMSLLLPSLTHAQKQGEQTHCLANQHQLMLAWLQYAMDHDDLLCDPRDPNTFTSGLPPYVPMREVFMCKSVEEGRGRISYGISNTMGGQERDGVKPFMKLHLVSRPTERMVFVDKEPRYSTCFWPVLRNSEKWVWRPWSWPPMTGLQSMTGRHNNGCNMAFADGHGEYTVWKDGRTRRLIKGLIAEPNEASLDNPDLEYMVGILTRGSDRTVPE